MRFYEAEVEREERQGKMRKAGLSSKTAAHVWSGVTSAFREAVSSKVDDLRALSVDITRLVQPPLKTDQREQEAPLGGRGAPRVRSHPSLASPVLRARTLHGHAPVRVGAAPGRRREPRTRHEHGRGTKSAAARRQIPIEKNLRALLVRLMKARKTGALLDVPASTGHNGSSAIVKADLERAELKRADLYRDDDVMMPVTFHALRHTAITHWVVAGRDQLFLMTCAGHLDLTMTRRYLRKAASVSSKFGQPHPPLPASLLGGAKVVDINDKRTA